MKNACAFGFVCAKFGKSSPCAHEDQYDADDPATFPAWRRAPFIIPEGERRA